MGNLYVPALQHKVGEIAALQKSTKNVLQNIAPLIFICKDNFEKQIDDLLRIETDNPFYIDAQALDEEDLPSQEIPVIRFCSSCDNPMSPLEVIPVVVFGLTTPNSLKAIGKFQNDKPVAIRLPYLALTLEIVNKMNAYLHHLGIPSQQIDLLLDLELISPDKPTDHYVAMIWMFFEKYLLPNFKFRSITILGESFPETLSQVGKGMTEIPRSMMSIWKELSSKFSVPVRYGDYCARFPWFNETDPKILKPAASIRYTHENYYAFKGEVLKTHGFEQFRELSQRIVSMQEYGGQDFCFGDKFIHECANNSESNCGNTTTWVAVGVNRHLAYTVSQLNQ